MLRNEEVAKAWAHSLPAKSGNMWTDGQDLRSYGLLIGETDCGGMKILHNWTAKGKGFVSMTTSMHVGIASAYADEKNNSK
jgi:hypothetical protein